MIDIVQTDEFTKWLKRLKDAAARARILLRIQRLSLTENFGDAKSVATESSRCVSTMTQATASTMR